MEEYIMLQTGRIVMKMYRVEFYDKGEYPATGKVME
jgi:hypothetical protein